MKKCKPSLFLLVTVLSVSIASVSVASDLSTQERTKVKAEISFEKDAIINAFVDPIKYIQTPMLTSVEKQNEIKIADASTLDLKKWINSVLNSPEHLSKVSLGYKLVKLNCAIDSGSATLSMLSGWKNRRLENPEITITFLYDNAPKTEFQFPHK